MVSRVSSILILILLSCAGGIPRLVSGQEGSDKPDPLKIKEYGYDIDRGIKYGPISLHGYLSEYLSYNDNLLLTSTGKTWDFLVDSVAGARIDLKYGPHRAKILAEAEYVKGIQTSSFDHLNALVSLSGTFKGDSFYLEAKDVFKYEQRAENLYISTLPAFSSLGNWIKFASNELNLQGGYKIQKIGLELDAGLANWFFTDTPLKYMDHMDVTGALRLSYNLAKLRVFLSGDVGYTDFLGQYTDSLGVVTRLSDYMYYGGTVGATLDLSGKLQGTATFGIRVQTILNEGTLAERGSYTGFVASLGLDYKASVLITVGGHYYRALQFSGEANYQTTDSFSLYYRHELLPRLTGKLGLNFTIVTPGGGSSYYFFGGHALLDYRLFEWFHLGLRYDLKGRSTRASGGSYLDNVVSLSLTAFF